MGEFVTENIFNVSPLLENIKIQSNLICVFSLLKSIKKTRMTEKGGKGGN